MTARPVDIRDSDPTVAMKKNPLWAIHCLVT